MHVLHIVHLAHAIMQFILNLSGNPMYLLRNQIQSYGTL